MKRTPLRSRTGCQKCKLRRQKCDEKRPVCSNCARLGFTCSWIESHTVGGVNVKLPVVPGARGGGPTQAERTTDLVQSSRRGHRWLNDDHRFMASFDDPAVLNGSATSFISGVSEKSAMQYLFEQGTGILRYPTQMNPAFANHNPWRLGLAMMAQNRPPLVCLLAIASARLSRSQAWFGRIAIKYYTEAVHHVRVEMDGLARGQPPSETTCAIAGWLSIFEMILFSSPKARLAHFIGFHRLVEARIQSNLRWGPIQVFFEFYIHCLSDGALFHYEALVGKKDIHYIDEMLTKIEQNPRPFGKEVVGVPKDLTSAAYKMAWLLHNDLPAVERGAELQTISQLVHKWQPPYHTARVESRGLLALGQVYQLACMCLLRKVRNEDCDGRHPDVLQIVRVASSVLFDDIFVERPYISLGWPCVVLGTFAVEDEDRTVFRRILDALRNTAGLEGYRTTLNYLDRVWDQNLGHKAIDDPELLSTVHI